MSSDCALEVKNLSKVYQLYEQPHHRLMQMLLGRWRKPFYREFWALRNVSFSIPKGKIVGILGKNGAGKSTLLQLISSTLAPTCGEISIQGRVAALLELGAGFNPEFTGMENIYLNAQILGLSQAKTDEKLKDILAFADIGDFVNQPVKTYSSGMFARLAFSVVVHLEPDILIIDEALSVGDAWFQHKSMARMRQLMGNGCSVLFVSHSVDAVRALCDEAIWLDQGQIKMQGNVTDVTNAYMNDVFLEHNRITLQNRDLIFEEATIESYPHQENTAKEGLADQDLQLSTTRLDGGAVLSVLSKQLINSQGQITERLEQGEKFSLEFEVEMLKTVKNLSVGFLIKDQFGQELTGESYFNVHRHSVNLNAGRVVRFVFTSSMQLRGGQSYSLALRINQVSKWDRSDNVIIYSDELAMVFDVLADVNDPMWFKFKMPFEAKLL